MLIRARCRAAKCIGTIATAIFTDLTVDAISDLDLSYTPAPWDALQTGAQAWTRTVSIALNLPAGAA